MPSGTRAHPVRRSQRLRNNRLLGPGRGIDNPSAVASVMLAGAGEHALDLDAASSLRQEVLSSIANNQHLANFSLALYNMKIAQGGRSGIALARKQWLSVQRALKRDRQRLKNIDGITPRINNAINSVVVEVARHSAAFPN